ncbi:Oidioi.mRNA.OKI2018_I69.chr1.g948.t1.cds [Oikopleura dioica]|uniref:Oidioi.mRNA.OKI2018_I69.chr1.g948.t1.cds n=1 Tax=Oikopleura dioica TaxID=34765 RepID=A0ABN7SST8_OIKDI|nr:Oidioi.mRNA.OKI2018_I69.chr1.g948.t1.cds [Oikopleura dioica]
MRCGTLKECQNGVLAHHDEDDRVLLDDDRILEIDLVEIDPDLALEDERIDEAALGTVQMRFLCLFIPIANCGRLSKARS